MFDADKTRMIWLPYGEKNCDSMLSRFHLIPVCDERTDRIAISTSVSETIRKPPLVKAQTALKNEKNKQVRQQDAYLAIRPAYPRGCCPRAAKGDKTYLQPVFLHR